MSRVFGVVFAFALSSFIIVMSGCAEDTTGIAPEGCTPGRVESCPCVGGGEGVQVCEADGASFSACMCAPGMTSGGTLDMGQPPVRDMEEEEEEEEDEDMGEIDLGDMGLGCDPPAVTPQVEEMARQSYVARCATCHGMMAEGSPLGPALLEEVAEESDEELVEVILFGDDDMPPIPISQEEALEIVGFLVRMAQGRGYDLTERCQSY